VANLDAPDGGATIIAGNERVIAARLADARFFWEQDVKVPLEEQAEKLSGIVFHEKLGTMAEKVERVAKLARWLVETHPDQFPGATPETVERAARLAKADLVTGTVGEFPELQGLIGARIAEAQGEKPGVMEALRQHYAPVPEGCVPVAVALADRADTIARFFDEGLLPTGSKDPFALRRAMLGIVNMIRAGGLRLDAMDLFHATQRGPILDFLQERLRVQVRDEGVRPDAIDATLFWNGDEDVIRVVARATALQAILATEDGANLLAGVKRAASILRIEDAKDGSHEGPVDPARFVEPAERGLADALEAAAGQVRTAVEAEDFTRAMRTLASLRPLVDRFFDEVTVNAEDAALRRNRLAILHRLAETAALVADFSKVEA
jgi:glycyl-tRNA synthetase beta chain